MSQCLMVGKSIYLSTNNIFVYFPSGNCKSAIIQNLDFHIESEVVYDQISVLTLCLFPWSLPESRSFERERSRLTRRGLLLYTDCTSPENDNGISLFYIWNPIIQKYQLENGVKRWLKWKVILPVLEKDEHIWL